MISESFAFGCLREIPYFHSFSDKISVMDLFLQCASVWLIGCKMSQQRRDCSLNAAVRLFDWSLISEVVQKWK